MPPAAASERATPAALGAVWQQIQDRRDDQGLFVVAVDGRSGAGKSSLASGLQQLAADRLGRPLDQVARVEIEDLYAGWTGLEAAPALLEWTVLRPLRRGARRVSWPVWDWSAGRYGSTRTLTRPASGLVVVEGVGCSAPPAREQVDHVVWVEADAPTRREGVRARQRQLVGHDDTDQWWDAWTAAEDRLLAQHPPTWHQRVDRSLP